MNLKSLEFNMFKRSLSTLSQQRKNERSVLMDEIEILHGRVEQLEDVIIEASGIILK
jgi:hypothetical protein